MDNQNLESRATMVACTPQSLESGVFQAPLSIIDLTLCCFYVLSGIRVTEVACRREIRRDSIHSARTASFPGEFFHW